jgi:outer membrane receptor protein involved in Fe transport
MSPRARFLLLSGVFAGALWTLPAGAQTAPAPAASAADLAKYDLNHNGRLDPTEVAARDADNARTAATVPVTTAPAAAAGSDIVELSPFEVSAEEDNGYLASNTLSGTRLNSKIEDLASSITVVTKQQMLDTAAVDINDIFLYEANTEGTGNYTEFSVGRNGDVNDSVQSSPTTANRVRGIASANVARGNFASDSGIPVDAYNIDALELSRGPNSNIFGLGNASGTVNLIMSTANLAAERSALSVRGDSYGGYRANVDFNRPIIRNRLAVRALALYESTGFERKPAKDITRRQQAMFTFRPFRNTTLRGSYESYHNFARRPNALTPRDTTTYWKSAGEPTWNPLTQMVTFKDGSQAGPFPQSRDSQLPPGLISQGTGFYNRPSMFVDDGGVKFWTVNRTTTSANANSPNTNVRFLESATDIMRQRGTTMPLFTTPGINDRSLYDWTDINYVAPNYQTKKADTYSVELEQFFFSTPMHLLAAQAGFMREDIDNYSRNFINGNSSILFIDVNETLLDGTPNPYFKRPYLGASEPTIFDRPRINDNGRVQLAYRLNLTNAKTPWLHWLGNHQVAGYLEGRRLTSGSYRFREVVLSDESWVNLANRANSAAAARAYFRYYLGDANGQNIDYAPPALYGAAGEYTFNYYNGVTRQWIAEPATFGEAGVTPSDRNQREIRSRGGVLQSFWFNDRIVTTVGTRRDRNRTRNSGRATVDPSTGLVVYDNLNTWGDWTEQAGTTATRGIVVKPFRNWRYIDRQVESGSRFAAFVADALRSSSFYYNKADTFQPANTQYNLFGELLPNPSGKGKDYGFSFSLFNRKLSVRINRYDNSQINSRGGDAGVVATRANRLDFGGDDWNLEDVTRGWVAQLHPEYTTEQLEAEAYKLMQLPDGFIDNVRGRSISETQDVSSKGWEIELNYNPSRNFRLKLTGAQQKTIDTNLSPNIQRYFDFRLPAWQSIRSPIDNSLWWDMGGDFGGPRAFYESLTLAPYKLAIANQGKPRSQVREWRWNALASYNLAGLGSEHHWLNNTSIGSAVRWEDKASIGFLGAEPDADGVIRTLDKNSPVFDEARTYFDFFATYSTRLWDDRIKARFQLNVRNAFEGGRLQVVSVNPDGSPSNFRIIDPRQFILTASFDL